MNTQFRVPETHLGAHIREKYGPQAIEQLIRGRRYAKIEISTF